MKKFLSFEHTFTQQEIEQILFVIQKQNDKLNKIFFMSHPLDHTIYNPTFTDRNAPSPEEGKGILKAIFTVNTILCGEIELERYLAYEYKEVEPKYLEIWVTNPNLINATSLEDDLREAFRKELPGFKIQTINFL